MSQPIALAGKFDLRGALARTSALARHVTVRQAWFEFGWRWPACVAGLFVFDLLFALPAPLRWLGLIGLLAYPVVVAVSVRRRVGGAPLPEEHSARLVEEGHPGLDNALINAVQFGRMVAGAPAGQADLMRREISRAEQAVAATPIENVVRRDGERRARNIMFGAMGAWVLACVLLPGMTFTILPRLFAPWLDNITPPFSFTKIDLEPKGASVRFGGSLVVQVAVKGPIPESLALNTRTASGKTADAPLEGTEPGKYTVTLNDLKQDTWIMASGGGARSGRYLVKIVLPPVASGLQATYAYPAYTKRKELTEQVGDRGIHGWRDTKVRLQISANRELTGGELVILSPDATDQHFPLDVSPKDARTAVANFPISASGTFRVALASEDRQVNSDAAHGKIVMEADNRPNVWFDEPAQSIIVTPDMKVGLAVGADDDIGVTRVDLHRVINGIADNEKRLYQGVPIQRTGARLVMDMADLGVRPGDQIVYYADAFDNDPGRPNYAETEAYTIKVMSTADYKKMLKDQRDEEQLSREVADIKDALGSLAERQQELADKMDKLAKALEKKPGDPSLTKQMAQAQEEQKKLQAEARQMAKRLQDYAKSPSASPIEAALKKQVASAAESLAQAADAMIPKSPGSPSAASEAAKKAADALKKTAGQAEKSMGDAIKNIEKVAPLFEDVERFMSLLDRQGQLVLESRQYEQKTAMDEVDRSKLGTIGAEQAKIKEELRALQEDFRRHAADARADFPKAAASAVKIADEIGRRQIPDIMDTAQTDFGQERGPDGFANAKKAKEQMEAMIGTCRSGQGDCKGELNISLSRSLGQSGLGNSLSACLNPGRGIKDGSGSGSAAGGMQSGGTGAMANGNPNNAVAYTMSMHNLSKSSGGHDPRFAQRMPGQPADLSADRVEKLTDREVQPPKAADSATKGYPPEYRKLIRDYFISVSKEQKP